MNAVTELKNLERPIDPLVQAVTGGKYKNVHFVDIENLVGAGKFGLPEIKAACKGYTQRVNCTPDDLFVITAGPQNASVVYTGWNLGKKIYQFRKGENGADLALISLFDQIKNIEVFEHVYLGSGDHSLEPIARKSKEHGVALTVVTGRGGLSNQFRKYEHIQMELNAHA
jgi:hypothetical protein